MMLRFEEESCPRVGDPIEIDVEECLTGNKEISSIEHETFSGQGGLHAL